MAGERVLYRDANDAVVVPSQTLRFLLGDTKGGYLALGAPNASNYDGWYTTAPDGTRWKILYDLAPTHSVDALEIDTLSVLRRAGDAWQEFRMSDRGLRMRGRGAFLLILDCKQQGDESDQGRAYTINGENKTTDASANMNAVARVNTFTITYEKHNDGRIAPDNITAKLFVGVASTFTTQRREAWHEVRYAYDERRGTKNTRWVRDTAFFSGDGELAMAIGTDVRDAQRKAVDLLLRPPKENVSEHLPQRIMTAPFPTRLAWRSMHALRVHGGFFAGFPWFHQRWSRDELISIGALLVAKDNASLSRAAVVIDSWYRAVRADGSLPAIHPDAGLRSADAPGWLGRRTLDLLATDHFVPVPTLALWRDTADRLISALPVRDDLVWSQRNETWMDTEGGDDGRAGARIEIQALALVLLAAHAKLCERTGIPVPERTQQLGSAIAVAVRTKLVRDGRLLDGVFPDGTPDVTMRPNVFLAWYVWPQMLHSEEWRTTFWRALEKLWLPWGGLATIDPADSRYKEYDTGEQTAAYHRGDSWHFLNAIAAIALRSVDPNGARAASSRLLLAIERDLFSLGYAGHISELSSAREQDAMGCHAQLWSAACYVEATLRHSRG